MSLVNKDNYIRDPSHSSNFKLILNPDTKMTTPLHQLNLNGFFSTFIKSRFSTGTTTHSNNYNDNDATTEPVISINQSKLLSTKHYNNNNINTTTGFDSIAVHSLFTQSTAPEGDP